MSGNVLIEATSLAMTSDPFNITEAQLPLIISANDDLFGIESIVLQMSADGGSGNYFDVKVNQSKVQLDAEETIIYLNVAGWYRVVKTSTSAQVKVVIRKGA